MRSVCTARPKRCIDNSKHSRQPVTHLLLEPVTRHSEQLETLAEIVSR